MQGSNRGWKETGILWQGQLVYQQERTLELAYQEHGERLVELPVAVADEISDILLLDALLDIQDRCVRVEGVSSVGERVIQ